MGWRFNPQKIFQREKFDPTLLKLLEKSTDLSPTSLVSLAIDFFSSRGISVEDPTKFFPSVFLDEGILTKKMPSTKINEDIKFGWMKARVLADLDIGQTLVVKDRSVVAEEGMEGTDEAIRQF